jgi:hypothetical protein
MIRDLNINKHWSHAIFFTILSQLARAIPFNVIFGSFASFFSCIAICMPLSGAFGGASGAFLCLAISSLFKMYSIGIAKLVISYHIPTFFASLYWTIKSRLFRIGVPAFCFLLFVMHPVGASSFIFALYWLIPIAISAKSHNSLFLTALASTFTAHAVGSVLYLYCTTITPLTWYTLLPIVPLERIAIATAMVALYKTYALISSHLLTRKSSIYAISE